MTGARWRALFLVLAALAAGLGALYAAGAAGLLPALMPSRQPRILNAVRPGFIGVADFGHWRLICTRAPPQAVPVVPAPSAGARESANTCRLNQEVSAQQDAAGVIFAANLSRLGPQRKPAMMLRIPPSFHSGDAVALRFDGDQSITSAVHDCNANECVAATALSDQDWNRLIAARTMQIVFPVAGGQTAFVDLAVDGLDRAAAALETAENVASP